MSNILTVDYHLEVLRNKVAGHSMVSIIGHTEALTTSRVTLHPSAGVTQIDQSSIDRTAGVPSVVSVASTSVNDTNGGSGLRTALVFGLDVNGNAISEEFTMAGQAKVTGAVVFSAVFGWRAISWGATKWNEGVVWVGTGAFVGGIPPVPFCSGDIRANRSHTAYYVVPLGKTLYLRQFVSNISTANKDVEIYVEQSVDGVNWFTEAPFGFETSSFVGNVIAIPGLPEGTHFRIDAKSSAMGTDVLAIMGCELIDN